MAKRGSITKGIFYLFLALIPFQFALNASEGVDIAVGRLVALLLAFFLAGFALKRRSFTISSSALSFFLALFFLWSGMSLFWGEDSPAGIRKFLFLANFFPLFWLLPNLSRYGLERFKPYLLYSAFAVSLVGIGQFIAQFIFGAEGVFQFWASLAPYIYGKTFSESILTHPSWLVDIGGQTTLRAIAFFPDPHIFGFYLAFVIPLAFFSKKILFKICGIIFVVTLLLTFSRAAYIGALAALISYNILKLIRNYSLFSILYSLFFLVTLIVALFFTPIGSRFFSSFNLQEGSIAGRLENVSQAISLVKEHPLIGVGLGNYARALDPLAGERSPVTAHNLYLDIWAELGIVGLFLFLGVLFFAFAYSLANSQYPIFLTLIWFAAQSLFDTPMFSVHILPLLIVFLGIADANNKGNLKVKCL
ncbi:MAG: O-antigen ligase family protein [Candidatus Colwellbacteria bacterium]|nr:O-antigen ligase family protein [Candidatus Colwellbacteria bacterium]